MRDTGLPLDKASMPVILDLVENGKLDLDVGIGYLSKIYGTHSYDDLIALAVKRGDREITTSQLELLNKGVERSQFFRNTLKRKQNVIRR